MNEPEPNNVIPIIGAVVEAIADSHGRISKLEDDMIAAMKNIEATKALIREIHDLALQELNKG